MEYYLFLEWIILTPVCSIQEMDWAETFYYLELL